MKNLVLATLLCSGMAQLGTGCLIVGDDDNNNPPPPPPPDAMEAPDAEPPPPPETGDIQVTWTLLAGDAQEAVPCPPYGVDIVVIADPDPEVSGDEAPFMFDCVAGEGLAVELDPAIYDVWVELLDADGNLIAQSDIQEEVPLNPNQQVDLEFIFSLDRGRFAFTWTIIDGGQPATCQDVGAEEVGLLLTVAGTTFADDYLFSCEAGEGVTDPLPIADEYVGDIDLLDNSTSPPTVLGSADAANMTLDYGNHFNDLGNFQFTVE